MIEKVSKISQITIDEFKNILVKIDLLLVENSKILATRIYRFSITSADNIDTKTNEINTILSSMGENQIDFSVVLKIYEVIK